MKYFFALLLLAGCAAAAPLDWDKIRLAAITETNEQLKPMMDSLTCADELDILSGKLEVQKMENTLLLSRAKTHTGIIWFDNLSRDNQHVVYGCAWLGVFAWSWRTPRSNSGSTNALLITVSTFSLAKCYTHLYHNTGDILK